MLYLSNSGQSKLASKIYIGDSSNTARKVVKIYCGDENGRARIIYSDFGSSATYLSAFTVSSETTSFEIISSSNTYLSSFTVSSETTSFEIRKG